MKTLFVVRWVEPGAHPVEYSSLVAAGTLTEAFSAFKKENPRSDVREIKEQGEVIVAS